MQRKRVLKYIVPHLVLWKQNGISLLTSGAAANTLLPYDFYVVKLFCT